MSEQRTRLREIGAEEFSTPQQETNQAQANASLQLLMLALKTLSQRTIVAVAALRGLLLAGTVFWLALTVVESPSTPKLVGLGLYAAFVLIAEFMGSRRR